ncbi:hypothetical protein EKO27_g3936 [Xylaria grammica]|uniref:Uncharacterized protein n=1 Tax=Xylaria grammica TaxID=363999 RepID=A0A439D9W1_9PEZI|nr:hypothetical protein EKO27_g3936 [Xylaria grammica]
MFPGSGTDMSPARQQESASAQGHSGERIYLDEHKDRCRMVKFNSIIGWPHKKLPEDWESQLLSWIEECHSSQLRVDINRLARYCVYLNYLPVVEYLVRNENADLTQQDKRGRSAIFYAMSKSKYEIKPTDYLPMLKYIVSSYPDKSADAVKGVLDQKDKTGERTPLHYAVESTNLLGIEFLLAMNASTGIRDRRGKTAVDLIDSIDPTDDPGTQFPWQMRLIFEFNERLEDWKNVTIGEVKFHGSNRYLYQPHRLPTKPIKSIFQGDLTPLQSGTGGEARHRQLESTSEETSHENSTRDDGKREPTWLHVSSGIMAFALLRRYGRQIDYTLHALDAILPWYQESHSNSLIKPEFVNGEPKYSSNFTFSDEVEKVRKCAIVFPCLVLRNKEDYKKAMEKTMEWKSWVANDFKKLVQYERTLDETYFPVLDPEDRATRNEDQVVSKEKETTDTLLTVPQLRLWRFDDCVLTAYPEVPAAGAIADQQELKWIPDSDEVGKIRTPEVLTGLIIAHHISKFGERQLGKLPSPLDIFETSVFRVLLKVEAYLKLPEPVMKEEDAIMFHIYDIREELVMIQQILGQQLDIVTKLIQDVERLCSKEKPPESSSDFRGLGLETLRTRAWQRVELSKVKLHQYRERVDKIDANAERIEQRIQDRLNLRRTFTSIKDARASLMISTAVIGFTIITIIFAPLSFMTSLFALPIDILSQNQYKSAVASENGTDSTTLYSTRYVGTWFFVAEIATIIFSAVMVAISIWFLRHTEWFAAQDEATSRASVRWLGLGLGREEQSGAATSADTNGSGSRSLKNRFRRRDPPERGGLLGI